MNRTIDETDDLRAHCEAAERRIEELERAASEALSKADAAAADLKLAQRIARIGNWFLDPSNGTPIWSDMIYTLYERDPSEGPILLAEAPEYYSDRDWRTLSAVVSDAIEKGQPFEIELPVALPSGRTCWTHIICEPESDPGPAGHRLRGTVQDITERKITEEQLRVSEDRFRTLVENAPDVVFALDAEGRFTDVSPNWNLFVGEPAHSAIGQPFDRYLDPEDARRCRGLLTTLLTTGERQTTGEYQLRRGDGEWRWHFSNASPLRDKSGTIIGCVGIARDVTETRRAVEALAASEARHRLLAENFPNGVLFLVDREFRYLSAGGDGLASVGLTTEAVVGRKIPDVFPEIWTVLEPNMKSAFEGQSVSYDVEYRDRWFRSQAVPIPGTDGTIDQVIVVVQDITKRKLAEEALSAQRTMLEDAERLAGVGSWAWHVQDDRWEYSDNWLSIHGCADPPSRLDDLFELAHPADEEAIRAAMDTAASGREPYEVEHRIVRPDTGEIRIVKSYGEATQVVNGAVVTINGAALDVTDQRHAEAEREKLRDQLGQAQKMESVGRLAGGVAHDFNNMLSVILGHAEIASMALAPDAPERSHLDEIRRAGERSANLVRQLLAFARRQTVTPKNLDLNQTIGDMLSMLRRLIGENIDLVWNPGQDLEPVRLDPNQVDQVLANLVVNARDAIDGIGRIEISTRPIEHGASMGDVGWDHGVAIEVQDDGQGMDEATLDQIFEPFFTTKGVGEGTGLGLATVYGIVKQNRGAITVSSRLGEGTRFTMLIPSAPTQVPVTEAAPVDHSDLPTGSETVLLVEDEGAIVSMGRRMLESLGYTVLAASNPSEALRLAILHRADLHLLLTDVVMPQMDGKALTALVLEQVPNLVVLYMSGHPADVISDHGVLCDRVNFLAKPFTIRGIAEAVRSALDASPA